MKSRLVAPRMPAMPSRRKALFMVPGVLTLGGLYAAGLSGMPNRTLRPPADPIPNEYFGMHMHHADTSTPWPSVRFGSWRLWDAYAGWPQLEPRRGQWDFARLDRYVAMAKLTGVNLLLPLGLSPEWASARPGEPSVYRPGNSAEPKNLTDWRNYVRTIAERYKGRIRYYELWNEPNLRNFYTGSVEAMLHLAHETYAVLKQVDEQNLLAAPATTEGGKQLEWLDRYLAAGGGNYLDVLSHHFYVPRENPEAMLGVMDDIRGLMKKHGVAHKPVWNTETGWWFDKPTASSTFTSWKKLKPDESAAYVARALILGWAAGMRRFYWYSWEHGNMGLVEGETYALNIAGKAYSQAQGWLAGAVMSDCVRRDGHWSCTLVRSGNKVARIVWRENGQEKAWSVPAIWGAKDMMPLGADSAVPLPLSGKILLGETPILLHG